MSSTLLHVCPRKLSHVLPSIPPLRRTSSRHLKDYEACFTEMTHNSAFQNVAARMVSGHYAYDGRKKMCLDKQQGSGDGSGDCAEDLRSVIQGACNINFVAMW